MVKKRKPIKAKEKVEPEMKVASKIMASLKRVHMRVRKY